MSALQLFARFLCDFALAPYARRNIAPGR